MCVINRYRFQSRLYLSIKVSRMCCETIEKVFKDDVVGEVSLEVCSCDGSCLQ